MNSSILSICVTSFDKAETEMKYNVIITYYCKGYSTLFSREQHTVALM